jgi:hypothetical protein
MRPGQPPTPAHGASPPHAAGGFARLERIACAFGRHRPAGRQILNNDIWVARCRGCRRDIVREEGGRWRIPRGFRVVWKTIAQAQADSWTAVVAARQARSAAAPATPELPIQGVLDNLPARAAPAPVEAEAPAPPATPAEPAAPAAAEPEPEAPLEVDAEHAPEEVMAESLPVQQPRSGEWEAHEDRVAEARRRLAAGMRASFVDGGGAEPLPPRPARYSAKR